MSVDDAQAKGWLLVSRVEYGLILDAWASRATHPCLPSFTSDVPSVPRRQPLVRFFSSESTAWSLASALSSVQ
eukprot:scaffold2093_cov425-Prasinococcus_capsulatus_cf.AAC.2